MLEGADGAEDPAAGPLVTGGRGPRMTTFRSRSDRAAYTPPDERPVASRPARSARQVTDRASAQRGLRRARLRRAARRRRIAAGIVAAVAATAVVASVTSFGRAANPRSQQATTSAAGPAAGSPTAQPVRAVAPSDPPPAAIPGPAPTRFAERSAAVRLPAPLQNAAAADAGGVAVLAGGLDAADVSVSSILTVDGSQARPIGRLPVALHDAPAVAIGSRVYLFGGGDGVSEHDAILEVDAGRGTSRRVGTLPARSSDSAAAAIGRTAYVVGGYTGSRWLDTIVAWRPGGRPRVVAHLPQGLRYAAVAVARGLLVIAGGTLPDGSASRLVYVFDPGAGTLRHAARLPRGTTHAAAAAVGNRVLVLGGRGATSGSAVDSIVVVDPVARTIRRGGRLRTARSDLAAVALGDRVLLAGGRERGRPTDRLSWVAPAGTVAAAPATTNVYAATAAGMLTGAARGARPLVYVPNGGSNTVVVIDQTTYRIVGRYKVGRLPQHVTPSWDLTTLWVSNNKGNSLQAFNPVTGRPRGRPVPVADPYNLYATPDGRSAIVVEEANRRLTFRDPKTWRVQHRVAMPCAGVDHMDFSADGGFLLASCEFSGDVVRVDLPSLSVHHPLHLADGAMPQDVKLSPDGRTFYVAEMMAGGVYLIDGSGRRKVGFIGTGAGAHGLYPSRNARDLYITNRGAGTISVLRFASRRIVATWRIPHGSPDMGGVSADGRTLWLSGRTTDEVYAIDTRTGRLRARIPVDHGPHGLAVWPQPGRYSLGHTGILR